jgi:L-lactate utilization protein LutC
MEITDEEKSQFMAVIKPMQQKMEAVAAEAQHGTNVIEFEHQVLGLRAELERQMEAVLTDAQRKQWKELTGKPIAIEALFDLPAGQS